MFLNAVVLVRDRPIHTAVRLGYDTTPGGSRRSVGQDSECRGMVGGLADTVDATETPILQFLATYDDGREGQVSTDSLSLL